jgi:tetratricopeptide (TPR) repeat protein
LWHWIIDLEVTQKYPVADDFYQIKPSYWKLLQRYINTRASRSELVIIFDKCARNEIDPQYFYLYKAERIAHQIRSNPSDIPVKAIDEILNIFRYEQSVITGILESLRGRLPAQRMYRIYQTAATIPTRKQPDSILIFPTAIFMEKLARQLRPRKFTVFPLYIVSLVYQTWSNHEKSINALKLAVSYLPDENSRSAGVLLSRLALSYIMVGNMSKAKESLLQADRILEINTNEWIDNQLNKQIWHLKRGYWEEARKIGLSLEKSIKEPYLKAKHAHILGVNYLYVGSLDIAERYGRKCEELSGDVTPSSWVIGKAWRNRFAYALLSTLDLVNGSCKSLEEQEKYFHRSVLTARDTTRRLSPLFRWILGCTVDSHSVYTEASIAAIKGDYLNAERKYLQLQQDKYLEVYYRISSKLDLATIYLKTNRVNEAINLYKYCAKKASELGFKYLEIRALKKICDIRFDESLATKIDALHRDIYTIGSSYIDNLEFLILV